MTNPSHDKGNVAELLRIGGQMANVMYNLAQRRDDSLAACADDLRKQWDAARATPLSPSTAPEVDERAVFEAWVRQDIGMPDSVPFNWDTEWVKAALEGWQARAALASRPAEVDDPPQWWHELQAAAEALDDAGAHLNAESVRKIAEQYRQGQRDAVAADRAREWFVVGGRRVGRTYIAALARDAERYRWIREAQWFKAGLAKTEAHATSFHYSGDLLDNMVDQGRGAGERTRGGSR